MSNTLPPFPAFRLDLHHGLMRGAEDRAEAMVNAAAMICMAGGRHEHLGRGPVSWDEVGLMRACAQAAVDHYCAAAGREAAEDLPDIDGYPATQGAVDPGALNELLLSWGMRRVATARDFNLDKNAQAGDVMIFLGRGPVCGVVTSPWIRSGSYPHFRPPATATVWERQPPAVGRYATLGHHPLGLYRWPERTPKQSAPTAPEMETAL